MGELVISNLGENYSCSVFLDWNPLIFMISSTAYLHVRLKWNLSCRTFHLLPVCAQKWTLKVAVH